MTGAALEALACECYAVVKRECDRLLPPAADACENPGRGSWSVDSSGAFGRAACAPPTNHCANQRTPVAKPNHAFATRQRDLTRQRRLGSQRGAATPQRAGERADAVGGAGAPVTGGDRSDGQSA